MRTVVRGSPREHSRRTKWLVRMSGALLAFIALISGGVISGSGAANALPRGEVVSFPGGLTLSNFVLPGGKRAYCIEVVMGEPTGQAWHTGRLGELPGRAGVLNSWGNPSGMRQMNYLIDRYGQNGDAWTAAAVQLTVWRMRENFLAGNPQLNQKIAVLQSSQQGRDLIARSDQLYADAKANAKAPSAAPTVTGKLSIAPDPSGRAGRYRVAYPKGAASLSVAGGTFVQNGATTLAVSTSTASARYVDIAPAASTIKVSGSWRTAGQAGWEPQLDVYDTTTATGGSGQRVAVATGKSSVPTRSGTFAAVTATPPPKLAPPLASSLAQPSADVGGTMKDELRVRAQNNTTLDMWPSATATFTAYLLPEAGSSKYTSTWEPVLGDPYEVQSEDEATGEPLWDSWWANEQGDLLLDGDGAPVPVEAEDGSPTSGIAADGTPYPVGQVDEVGEPVTDDGGNPVFHTVKTAVLEERRDPLRWSAEELSAMSANERCLAQPVFHESGISVPTPGNYSSTPTTVRSGGTVHWVERVYSRGQLTHEGICGLANETTRINQPGVVTQAPAELLIGDEAYDTATVTGTLLPDVNYTIRFEAYRAADELAQSEESPVASVPSCTADNIVFRSARVPVTETGEVRSPGFILEPDHGTKLWWVETLEIDEGSSSRVLHRGECGLENETTRVAQPTVETLAVPDAVVGDHITDTAILGGAFAENEGATWELDFRGYRATNSEGDANDEETEETEKTDGEGTGEVASVEGDEVANLPVCDANNLLFEVPPVSVAGPGEVTSAPVFVQPEWRGEIWWVETLWLVQGDKRTAFAAGECGLVNETTRIDGPTIETRALPLATVGDAITDTATVTGPLSAREGVQHEVTFEAFLGDDNLTGSEHASCTAENLIWTSDPVQITAPGEFESPSFTVLPAHGDTVWWIESLWTMEDQRETAPDAEPTRTLVARGECGLENETTRVQYPDVATIATSQVTVGEPLFDTAIVEGALSQRDDIEYRIRFTAYKRPSSGEMTCRADTEIPELSDHEGVVVTRAGRYESKKIITTSAHVGLGGYVETLVMIEGGEEHLVHRGACGAPSENFEIVPVDVPTATSTPGMPNLARTGAAHGPALGAVMFAVLTVLAGAGVFGFAAARKGRKKS